MRLSLFPFATGAVLLTSCFLIIPDEAKPRWVHIKDGALRVQTENFLASANDKPAEYELSWGKFELTSNRLNVVIVEGVRAPVQCPRDS